MSMIKVRLKPEFGRYLILTSPKITFIIKDGGENDPDGFEVDKEFYERELKSYVEPAPKRKKRKKKAEEKEEMELIEEKSEDEIVIDNVEE